MREDYFIKAVAVRHAPPSVALNAGDEVAWYRLSQADRALGNREDEKKALTEFQHLHSQIAMQQGTNVPGEVTKQALQNDEVR